MAPLALMLSSLNLVGGGGAPGWWPSGSVQAADFANDRYMSNGAASDFGTLFDFTRSTANYATDSSYTVSSYAINTPAIDDRGLLIQPALTRLNANPANPQAWTSIAGASSSALTASGPFSPLRIISGGNTSAGYYDSTAVSISSGTGVRCRVRYKQGTSANIRIDFSSASPSSALSGISGPVGNLSQAFAGLGGFSDIVNTDLGGGLYEVTFMFNPTETRTDVRFRVGPFTSSSGEYVDCYGAQAITDPGSGRALDWALGTPPQGADVFTLNLPAYKCVVSIECENGTTYQVYDVQGDTVVSPTAITGSRVQTIAVWPQANSRLFFGDSYIAISSYEWARKQDINIAVGGTTPDQQLTAFNALSADVKALPTFWWDGGIGGIASTAAGETFIDDIVTAKTAVNTRFHFMTPTAREELDAANTIGLELYEYAESNYADYFLPYESFLDADPTTKIVPTSSTSDGTHPTVVRMEAIKAYVLPLMV